MHYQSDNLQQAASEKQKQNHRKHELKKLLAQIDSSQSGSVKLELFVTLMALY